MELTSKISSISDYPSVLNERNGSYPVSPTIANNPYCGSLSIAALVKKRCFPGLMELAAILK